LRIHLRWWAPQFHLRKIVDGFDPLENPSGVITNYGFLNDFPVPEPVEPTQTEPDQNLYLVFDSNPGGPTSGYDAGGVSVPVDPPDPNSRKNGRRPTSVRSDR
jgi:hypothetical protein